MHDRPGVMRWDQTVRRVYSHTRRDIFEWYLADARYSHARGHIMIALNEACNDTSYGVKQETRRFTTANYWRLKPMIRNKIKAEFGNTILFDAGTDELEVDNAYAQCRGEPMRSVELYLPVYRYDPDEVCSYVNQLLRKQCLLCKQITHAFKRSSANCFDYNKLFADVISRVGSRCVCTKCDDSIQVFVAKKGWRNSIDRADTEMCDVVATAWIANEVRLAANRLITKTRKERAA